MTQDVRPRNLVDENPPPAAASPSAPQGDIPLREVFHKVNAFFYNKTTGLGLILAMAFLTLMGTLLEQAPDGLRDDPSGWNSWVESVRPRYGGWTQVLAFTGAFNIFSSIWFRVVTVMLALSIIACTCHRVPQLWRRSAHPHIHVSDAFFDHAGLSERVCLDTAPAETFASARAALSAQGYRIIDDERGPGLNLYADRFRWAPFGTAIAHASFVIILLGVFVTTTFGFKNPSLPVGVGTKAEIGHGTGLTVEAKSFTDRYTDQGRPLDYYSELVLFKDGRQVAEQTVRVNTPLRHEGVSIHQASYGIAAAMKITDAQGAQVYSGGVPLAWKSDDKRRVIGKVKLEGKNLTLYVVAAASGVVDRQLGAGQVLLEVYQDAEKSPLASQVVSQGQEAQIAGLNYTFERERQYTGLMIVRDPGAIWVWIGSSLMVLGLILTMFLHHRRIWVRVVPRSEGEGSELRIASAERQDTPYERWFHRFVQRLADPGSVGEGNSLDDYDRRRKR
ncbi:cytochrome c biogenesis protein ResB [Austwickia chelonae]|uniref:cytochrome c biogenesis protein ResB n=1 Tax=Austwickia chelonae TaxID=100225 RepID=UPI000E23531B|nr:cytochrome c biogenesis protein ResB [Austwickia chelonae]